MAVYKSFTVDHKKNELLLMMNYPSDQPLTLKMLFYKRQTFTPELVNMQF